jgi:hypothetical protein
MKEKKKYFSLVFLFFCNINKMQESFFRKNSLQLFFLQMKEKKSSETEKLMGKKIKFLFSQRN